MDIVKEAFGIAVVAIDGRYYVVGIDHSKGQVTSVLYADMPKGGGKWCGRISESGVRYVGHGSTRDTAMKHYRRLVREQRIEREAMRAGYASPTKTTITVQASQYEDHDDCLAAAADAYADEHPEAVGYDLSPRWGDNERTTILLDVPAED